MIYDNVNNINVYQFGVGGTGSWLVPPVCKILNNIRLRRQDTECKYFLIDDDIVEERNILRQNFNSEDIDRRKSTALVRKNIQTFKSVVPIGFRADTKMKISKVFDHNLTQLVRFRLPDLAIVIGTTDNNKSRRAIFNFLKKNYDTPVIYIDSGNNLHSGQVVTTIFRCENKGFINHTDFKNIKFLKTFPVNGVDETEQSCAFFGDQSQAINMMASTILFINIQKILIDSLLPPARIDFNSSGYSTFNI